MLDKKLEEHSRQESTETVDACLSETGDNETASKKKPVEEECQIIEAQEKTAVAKQARNTKKNAPKRLANANDVASREVDKQISFEPSSFDIILLVDTQETCG